MTAYPRIRLVKRKEKHMDFNQNAIDAINSTLQYNPSNPNELCPERKINSGTPDKRCRNLYLAHCVLLDHSRKWERNLQGSTIPYTVGCETRLQLLHDYDKCLANGTKSVFFAAMGGIIAEARSDETPYSAEAMAQAYERWQYAERKHQGEPVTFRAGRCLYDGAIFAAGIQPGAFPGLRFYMCNGKLIDPNWLRDWLQSDEFKGQKDKHLAVGYYGQPVCAARHWDVLGYYTWRYNIYGPETYWQHVCREPNWVRELFHHVYNVW